MLKKWGLRGLLFIGAVWGMFLVIAFALQVPAVGKSIGSSGACGTCHVMTHEVVTLEKSAHRDLACLDCHAPKGFIEKPLSELKSASQHMYIFLAGTTPDVIKPYEESLQVIQANCVACHAQITGKTHIDQGDFGKNCFDCHRATPHGRPVRN